jgi:pilus assembly protein Flp/PilA
MMIFIFVKLQSAVYRVMKSEEGQGLTEYALILALVAIVAIASLKFLSSGVNKELTSVATSL